VALNECIVKYVQKLTKVTCTCTVKYILIHTGVVISYKLLSNQNYKVIIILDTFDKSW